jgi:uncharacterized membrane protein
MTEKRERKEGMGGFDLIDILCPFLIPVRGITWVGSKLKETAEAELTDESKVQEELLELRMRFEMDEITEEEYEKREAEIMEKLEAIRKYKEESK